MKNRDELHRVLSTRMLIAGVNNAEVAANVAMEVIADRLRELIEERFVEQPDEATQRRIKFMEDGYDRSTILSHSDKERHKRVEREFILKQKGYVR